MFLAPLEFQKSFCCRFLRKTASTRARLRLDRASLNASLAQRRVVPDKLCPECKNPEETVEHCLCVCPRYNAERKQCTVKLAAVSAAPTLDVLLGNVEHLKLYQQNAVLKTTAEFLQQIHQIRKL